MSADSNDTTGSNDTTDRDGPGALVRHERVGRVDVLTLSNGKVNALSTDVLGELRDHAHRLAAGSPRAVVVTGGPKLFAAGADITQFGTLEGDTFTVSSSDEVARVGDAFLTALDAVAALPCPTIAAVNGVALGGGCELALACDFRVAAAGARFGQPEILLGIIPGGGGTQRLARLVGPARAKDLVFSGRSVDAAEALDMGLVDRVVDGDAVEAAMELAERYASGPRAATALAKEAVDRGLDGSLAEGLALEQRLFVSAFGTRDAEVGVASFLTRGPGKAAFD